MASVCIIGPSSLRYMPYLRYYEDALRGACVHEVLLWDRFGTNEIHADAQAYKRAGTGSGLGLVPGYLGFRQFVLRRLRARAYDLYIVLSVQIGVLLYDFLRGRSFILDVRDYSHENLLPYRLAGFDLVRRARLVCISSRGFLEWLPTGPEYVMSHNVSREQLGLEASPFDPTKKVLAYIGAVREYGANVRFMKGAAGRADWSVRYIGRGTCEGALENYCRSEGIKNVSFQGAFDPAEKGALLKEANFLVGIYGTDSPVARTGIPNRLYESCLHRRPLIVDKGTHLAQLVNARGLGAVIDLDDSSRWSSEVNWFYEPSHYQQYVGRCTDFLAEVEADVTIFEARVRSAVR